MLCQCCGENTATTFIQKTVNGKTSTMHLCAECAAKQGVTLWKNFDLGDFWGNLFAEPAVRAQADTVRCEGCGHSFPEIAESGRAGCPMCYTTFYDRLLPSIERIHGKARHVGKTPTGAGDEVKKENRLTELKQQLSESISRQEYEACARLRDQIRELENGTSTEEGKDHEQ